MTNKEMSEIFSVMMLAYPNAELFKGDTEKLVPTVKLWTQCFRDVPYPLMEKAVHRHIMTSQYPPTISGMAAQIKNVIGSPSPAALWEEFLKEVDRMKECIYYFSFSFSFDGKGRAPVQANMLYESMRPAFRAYAGSFSSFISICRRFTGLSPEALGYEQHRFDEFIRSYNEQQSISELLLAPDPDRKFLK